MLSPFVMAFGILMLVQFVQFGKKGFSSGDEGALYMIMGVICSMLGAGFTYAGIDELIKGKVLRGQKDRLLIVHFPE